jgi:LGFP repeat
LGDPTLAWRPTADEAPFSEGGRVSTFDHGDIYWWPDVGAVKLNEVAVHYTGLICFEETDWDQGSDSDEPYVILGIVSHFGQISSRSQVYPDVDDGESQLDVIELYRGKPYGLAISAMLMEHDEGDPDKYKAAMGVAVEKAFQGVAEVIELIPVVGAGLADAAGPALQEVAPDVTEELNRLLDLGDDKLGAVTTSLTPKQMVVLAARTQNSNERGVGFKVATPLISGDGASYKVYYGLVPA